MTNQHPGTGKPTAVTQAQAMSHVASTFLPGSNEALFWQWVADNTGRLKEAVIELGIEPPEPGPNLIGRTKEVVIPVLLARKHNQ